ncbi:S8 family serine peptidase [Gammaproteobacteria bacterium]|nr:S8 family serine peptidase [Gammaproteobacteria bacterium]MDA8799251.1 S8 family serine peptidase [Gammaproteobacteria bacterium]MDA9965290.1 S8 family serine peptidase [Gammaproteobacteria bacterium]MDC0332390.1 S8 family serine peptidase [Gammaproteobacteria bacterium]MDC0919665.1 S8 family serine peptidase [Gammaproteobacteria bacterium]
MNQNRTLPLILIILMSCGGGGGSSSNMTPVVSQTPTPPVAPPSLSFDELKDQYEGYYEYQRQWGLNFINASSAYARGATGAGITIGITDSGLDNSHQEISISRLSADSALSYSDYTPNTRQKRHGTAVASVAAGRQDKTNATPMHGVAFEADILFVAIQLAEPDPNYDPVDIGNDDGSGNVSDAPDFTGIDNFFSQLFKIYNDYDVNIVNNSYGYSGNIIDYTEAQVRYAFPKTIAEMSQVGTPDSEKTIYVWAAGNAGGYADQGVDYSSPELLPGMAHYIPEIQGHSIAVASVDETGQISDFSSRCGVAQDYCISAPGGRIVVAYSTSTSDTGIYPKDPNDDDYNSCITDNTCYAIYSGTSFAAPFVSGGLAVITDYFEGQLGSHEIVNRLFSTANKEGIYADKAVYGQGLMDLNAATNPIGQLSATMSLSLSGPMASATFSTLQLTSPSFGDALTNGIGNHSVIFFDELDAPFRRSLSSLVSDYRNQVINMDGFGSIQNPIYHSLITDDTEFEIGGLSIENLSGELVTPYHLLNAKADKNQFFSYYNHSSNSFLSHGLNGSWAMGIFQDSQLRSETSLRSQFSNPWLNFSAAGTTFGSIFKGNNRFDVALAISSGRNKFNANEIFNKQDSSTVALLEIQPKTNMPALQLGLMKENDASLGLSGSGAFNGSNNQLTSFVGLSNSLDLAGGKLFGSFYLGKSNDLSNELGMIRSVSKLSSSAFGIGFMKSSIVSNNDKLILTVDQPIRIESGRLKLNVPTYRTKEKNVLFNSMNFNLDPSGREIHTKAQYFSSYNNIGFGLTLGYKADPYHIKFMNDYWYMSLGFNINF